MNPKAIRNGLLVSALMWVALFSLACGKKDAEGGILPTSPSTPTVAECVPFDLEWPRNYNVALETMEFHPTPPNVETIEVERFNGSTFTPFYFYGDVGNSTGFGDTFPADHRYRIRGTRNGCPSTWLEFTTHSNPDASGGGGRSGAVCTPSEVVFEQGSKPFTLYVRASGTLSVTTYDNRKVVQDQRAERVSLAGVTVSGDIISIGTTPDIPGQDRSVSTSFPLSAPIVRVIISHAGDGSSMNSVHKVCVG